MLNMRKVNQLNKYQLTLLLEHAEPKKILLLSEEEDPTKVKGMLMSQLQRASNSRDLFMLNDVESGEDVVVVGSKIVGYTVKHVGKVTAEAEGKSK